MDTDGHGWTRIETRNKTALVMVGPVAICGCKKIMFNLETAIEEWRIEMLAAGVKMPMPLEELELHLREEIEEQMRGGRSETEAFEAAVEKVGQAGVIKEEFMKIDNEQSMRKWKLMEIAVGVFATLFPLWLVATLLWFKTGPFVDLTPGQQVSGLMAVLLFALLAWCGWLGYKVFPVVHSKRARGVIATLCVAPVMVWWYVFIAVIAQRCDFTMSQFGVALLWAFVTPAGLMMGLLWGMERAARRRTRAVS